VKRQPPKWLPFLLAALLAGVMAWYYSVYVHWQPKLFPLAVAASALAFLALAVSLVWSGQAKPGKKSLDILGLFLVFMGMQQGLSYWINNVIYAARWPRAAMRVVLPLLALMVAVMLIKPFRALSRKIKRAVGISAAALAALACIGTIAWAIPANLPLQEFVPVAEPEPIAVEKHSIADYRILYDGSVITDESAANILADTLNRVTGGENFASEANGIPSGEKEFIIGTLSGTDVSALGVDGYFIEADGSAITIAGGKRGVIYGVYHFLEEYFDCHWYAHDLEVIPQGPAEIAEVKSEQYVPPFEYRETDWQISPCYITYSAANGLNGQYRTMPEELGSWVGYNGWGCHSITEFFLKPEEFFDDHPDWYAWRDDQKKRVPTQLCLTNSEVLEEMIREVRWQIENGNGQPIVTVTQADNKLYCQCAGCKAVDEEEGSQAGTMLRFVNAIAEDIAEDYPDVFIDTFAYQYTRTPPKHVRPLPNVIIRLCSIECCFAHPLSASVTAYTRISRCCRRTYNFS